MGNRNKLFLAFTLAEMMVVMLIMSIVLAAMAPVVTTRMKSSKTENASPWKWSNMGAGPNAYFATADQPAAMAMIGQAEAEADDDGRLIINTANDYDHILFKYRDAGGDVQRARFYVDTNSMILNTNTGIQAARNTVFGVGALNSNAAGSDNTAIGNSAMEEATSSENTAVGVSSQKNSEGGGNTSIGFQSMEFNNEGAFNVAVGYNALRNNGEANNNVAIGHDAMVSNAAGEGNIAIGNQALSNGSRPSGNIAIGYQAAQTLDDPTAASLGNIAIGGSAMAAVNGSATHNIAIGGGANISMSEGTTTSIAIGNTTSAKSYGVAIGHEASANAAGGIAIGSKFSDTDPDTSAITHNFTGANAGRYGVAIGSSTNAGKKSVAIGFEALSKGGTGFNTAVGYVAAQNLKGVKNTAIGSSAMTGDSTGSTGNGNTAVGYNSLNDVTSGNYNTAIGYLALDELTTGSENTAIGDSALTRVTTGSYNTAIGYNSLVMATASYNTAIGYNACSGVTTGHHVTCIGANSGSISNVKDIYNLATTADGNGSGYFDTDFGINTNHMVYIGNEEDTVFIPGNLVIGRSILVNLDTDNIPFYMTESYDCKDISYFDVIHNNGTVGTGGADTITLGRFKFHFVGSDRRLKYVGTEFKSGLDKIRQLKVFNYTYKKDVEKTPHVGVIAQDLQKIFPDAVSKDKDGFLQIRIEDMFYAVVNAIKELDAKLTSIEKTLVQLQKDNKELKKENAELKARLDKIEAKLK